MGLPHQRSNISFDQILSLTRKDERNFILEDLVHLFQELIEEGDDEIAQGVQQAIRRISLNASNPRLRIPDDPEGLPDLKYKAT